jgi:hypothetical protein
MEEARSFLSLNNFNESLQFIQSTQHDVESLHKLIHLAGRNLHTYLHCERVTDSSLRS